MNITDANAVAHSYHIIIPVRSLVMKYNTNYEIQIVLKD